MPNYKKELSMIKIELKKECKSGTVMAGYLLGIWYVLSVTFRYIKFSGGLGIQPVEAFLLVTNSWQELSCLMRGYFLIMSRAPFINSTTLYAVIRLGDKIVWLRSMLGYIFTQTFMYWGSIFLCGSVGCLFSNCNFENQWSRTFDVLIKIKPKRALVEFSLPSFDEMLLKRWTPYQAAAYAFLLVMLYALILALVMFILNLSSSYPLGNVASVGIHFLGILMIKVSFMTQPKYSLLANAMLSSHTTADMSLGFGCYFMGLLGGVLLFLIMKCGNRCDYRVANGEKLW